MNFFDLVVDRRRTFNDDRLFDLLAEVGLFFIYFFPLQEWRKKENLDALWSNVRYRGRHDIHSHDRGSETHA
jgi:hypothetical protein